MPSRNGESTSIAGICRRPKYCCGSGSLSSGGGTGIGSGTSVVLVVVAAGLVVAVGSGVVVVVGSAGNVPAVSQSCSGSATALAGGLDGGADA